MFPFLQRDDCPPKFSILVADKNIAYNTVLKNRQLIIQDAKEPFLSDAERLDFAQQTVECFEDDQLMFDELIHFHETKQVLGNHPLFRKERLEQDINAMTGVEAVKAYKNLAPRISREKKKMRNARNEQTKQEFVRFIRELELQRKLLKARIDE